MATFTDSDPRFSGLERKAILFLGLAVLLVVAMVAAALVRQGYFTQTSRIYVFANSALGISKGMAVQLSGFKIGTVEDLSLEPDTRVKIQLQLQSDYLRHIPQDSQARLAKESLIGAGFIEIVPGSKNARPVASNAVLAFDRGRDFGAIAEELTGRINPILEEVRKFTASVNDPEGDLRQTLRNIRDTTAMIASMRGDLERLARGTTERVDSISGKVEQVLDGTRGTLDKTGRAIDTLGNTLATVDRELPKIVDKLDQSLKNVESVTTDARRIAGALGEQLPDAIREGRAMVEDTREIVDGAKRAWPIRNMLPQPVESAPALDSHESATPAK